MDNRSQKARALSRPGSRDGGVAGVLPDRPRRRAIRSCSGGWVEKRFMRFRPDNGLTISICAVDGLAFMGRRPEVAPSFSRALANASGLPLMAAPVASA